ncbi:TPA: hypothetical protein ACSQ42_000840 [Klebsiella aerogenes]|uniref:hypothetical protein n=1 Tax=Klebsiella pneumoniae TaxID=573 RepID=UPI0012556B6A|nr:hypothetical protein FCG65_013205 [Klebsiella pneumoniae]HBQ8001311.1 hypothetical protein [Klebsiella pneumoniae]HEK5353977.1 hypothetical protein [Klebsiella pneumoniae]HEK8426659.1 hypothetical protein [Klebsiella pneumoniae]
MQFLLLYLLCGLPLGLIEFISVLFIRDGGAVWLKVVYGVIAVLLWPLIFAVLFVPERILCKWRRALGG